MSRYTEWHIFATMTPESTEFFRALADVTRLRCLVLMQQEGELCVCELTHALGQSQPKISRHLAHLRDSKIVRDRREGQWIYYQVNPALPTWCVTTLQATAAGVADTAPFCQDRETLKAMPNRPGAACSA